MNEELKALSICLATLTPLADGWIRIDRDRAAAACGIGRVKLARLLAKAEKSMGIQVESDRVKWLSRDEIFQRHKKPNIPSLISRCSEVISLYDAKMSQNTPFKS